MRWSRPNTKRLRWHQAIRTGVSAATSRAHAFTGPGPPSCLKAMVSRGTQRLLPIVKSKSIESTNRQIQINRINKSIKSTIALKTSSSIDLDGTKFPYCTRCVFILILSSCDFHISVPIWYHTGTVHTQYCFPRNKVVRRLCQTSHC